MTNDPADRTVVRLGTRGSALARWQTNHVAALLQNAHPNIETDIEVIVTRGDQMLDKPLPLIGGKGLFTAELEAALREKRIDIAVHSLKDLPTEQPAGLMVGGVPPRENPGDVLVSRKGYTLGTLPQGAAVGTSSPRRAAQLKHHRPDLKIHDIRGNVDTRVQKAFDPEGPYDAIVLAYAGLARLDKVDVISEILPIEAILPAPGQGALGIQSRDDDEARDLLNPITDESTLLSVTAEREFLNNLEGGCSVPIGAYGQVINGELIVKGRVTSLDGENQIDVEKSVTLTNDRTANLKKARTIGRELGEVARHQGAGNILAAAVQEEATQE